MHSSELHIGSSIRYENALYGNYFLNCYIVKKIFNILQLFFLVYVKNHYAKFVYKGMKSD